MLKHRLSGVKHFYHFPALQWDMKGGSRSGASPTGVAPAAGLTGGRMKKIAVAMPALFAAALLVAGCAKPAEDTNVTVLNQQDTSDADAADANLTDIPPADLNATDANLSDAPANAR
jgi:hypothetical protein